MPHSGMLFVLLWLLLPCLFVLSIEVKPVSDEAEVLPSGILRLQDLSDCIKASKEESAVGRWIECASLELLDSQQKSALLGDHLLSEAQAQMDKPSTSKSERLSDSWEAQLDDPSTSLHSLDALKEALNDSTLINSTGIVDGWSFSPCCSDEVETILDEQRVDHCSLQYEIPGLLFPVDRDRSGDTVPGDVDMKANGIPSADGCLCGTQTLGDEFVFRDAAEKAFDNAKDRFCQGLATEMCVASRTVHNGEEDSESLVCSHNKKPMTLKVEDQRGADSEGESNGVGASYYLHMRDVGTLALSALLLSNCFRRRPSKKPQPMGSWKSSQHTRGQATHGSTQARLKGAKKAHCKNFSAESLPGILGSPVGTAIGAVFAEVILNSDCGSEHWMSLDELTKILETALTESLLPIVGSKYLEFVEKFKASFRSTYGTIDTVRQAHLKKPRKLSHQTLGKGSSCCHEECFNNEQTSSAKPINPGHLSDAEVETLCAKLLQQMNFRTDAGVDDQKIVKDSGFKLQPCHRGDPGSCAMIGSKDTSSFSLRRDTSVSQIALDSGVISTSRCGKSEETSSAEGFRGSAKVISQLKDATSAIEGFKHESSCGCNDCDPSTGQQYTCVDGNASNVDEDANSYISMAEQGQEMSLSCNSRGNDHSGQAYSLIKDELEQLKMSDNRVSALDSEIQDARMDSQVYLHSDQIQDSIVLAGSTHTGVSLLERGWQEVFLNVFQKFVQAQEHNNYIKSVELAQRQKHINLQEEQLQLASESNELQKQTLTLSQTKVSFKRSEALERRLVVAYFEFSRTCADELVAGLLVMIASLTYGVRKYSYFLLSNLVSACLPLVKEPRQSSWLNLDRFFNYLELLTSQLQVFVCHVTVTGRMVVGLVIVAVVAAVLLRQSVTSSSQAMPATIIIIVLGGVCGFAGKLSVDSLGGNGFCWLLIWEALCFLHALVTCFTPFMFSLLNGSPSSRLGQKFMLMAPSWARRFAFHTTVAVILPILAGQLPFASFRDVSLDLYLLLENNVMSPVLSIFKEWARHAFSF